MNFKKEMKENQPDRNHVLSGGHQRSRMRPLRPRAVVATASTLLATGWMVSPFGGLTALASTTLPSTDAPPVASSGEVQVSTAVQLEYIDQNQGAYLSKTIDLLSNIDLTGYTWVPLGSASTPFAGTFNGGGHEVTGLNISGAGVVGFLGYLQGTVENLGVQSTVQGASDNQLDDGVGGLVGYMSWGTILNSYTSGSVSGSSSEGGLVGQQMNGEIIDSHSADSVSGSMNGGLVGLQDGGTIADSYATGPISGGTRGNGGLVGMMLGGGPGGGTISNSYATGSVSGNVYADGGLVGYQNAGSGGITNSYATGPASGASFNFNGGLIGWRYGGGANIGDYYLLGATPYSYTWGITGLTATQMKQQSSFVGWDFTSKTASWAIDSSGNVNNGYPYWAAIITSSLPSATEGSKYQFTMMAFDRAGVKSWSATGLPTGITMDSSTGVLSGAAPLTSGNYSVTVTMQDMAGNTRSTSLSLDVAAVYAPTLGTTPTAAFGSSVGTTTVTATPNTSGDTLEYQVSTSAIATPVLNSAPPSGSGVFASGTNLTATAGDTVGVYEVNSSKQVVAFSLLTLTSGDIATGAPTLGTTPTAAPGSSVGTTTVAATPDTTGDTLVYQVSTSMITAPFLNSAQPSGSNVFTSGTNLSAAAGDTVGVYELNSAHKVVAFSSLTLTSGDIATTLGTTPTAPPVGSNGEVQVSIAVQLEYIDQNQGAYLSKTIDLLSNIDLTGYAWVPLGSRSTPFTGTFNGGGHAVTGLNISGSGDVGFLGDLRGTVENLGVQSTVQGTGGNQPGAGGLAGNILGGTILNSYTFGSVSGSYVEGGLVGQQAGGEIIDSHSADSVSGTQNGGLVGLMSGGNIADSYATGPISGGTGGNGGLVGYMEDGTIFNSYATGSVSGDTYADGGLVGLENTINNTGITNSYATGPASGSSNGLNGGLVGWYYYGTNNGDYYLLGATPEVTWGITGLTATQMSQQSSFVGWDFTSKTASWAIDSSGNVNNGYPYWAAIITSSLPSATEGSNYQFTMMAFDRAGVKSWSATGLPTGITMDSSTGVLSGAPIESGNYSVTVTMQDTAGNTRTTSLSLDVAAVYAPTLGTTPTAAPGSSVGTTTVTATPNTSGDTLVYQVSTSAIATPVLNSALPSGSGVFASGTNLSAAAGDRVGVYEVNSSNQVVAFSSITLTGGDIATDAPLLGATPTAAPGSSVGTTTVTATPNSSGDTLVYQVSASAIATPLLNSAPPSGSNVFTSGTNLSAAARDTVGVYEVNSSKQVVAFSSITLTKSDVLGATITYDGNGASGTAPTDSNQYMVGASPTVAGQGSLTKTGYTFAGWNTKADGSGTSYTSGSTLTVGTSNITLYAQWTPVPPLSVGTTSAWDGQYGVPYNPFQLQPVSGQAPYVWSLVSGSLPNGLTLSRDGVISGTPTGPDGTSTFTVQVTDVNGRAARQTLSIQITGTAPLSITTGSLPPMKVGTNDSVQLAGVGASPFTWSVVSGQLPTGLSLDPSGTLSGVPTKSGSFTFDVQLTNGSQTAVTKQFTVTVAGLPRDERLVLWNGQRWIVPALVHQHTTYVPIWYVMQLLKPMGVSSTWNGTLWHMTTTKSVNLTSISAGHGTSDIYMNGTLVQHVTPLVAIDPWSQKSTTYMPIWYVMQLLKRVGLQSTWNGTTWTVTK